MRKLKTDYSFIPEYELRVSQEAAQEVTNIKRRLKDRSIAIFNRGYIQAKRELEIFPLYEKTSRGERIAEIHKTGYAILFEVDEPNRIVNIYSVEKINKIVR